MEPSVWGHVKLCQGRNYRNLVRNMLTQHCFYKIRGNWQIGRGIYDTSSRKNHPLQVFSSQRAPAPHARRGAGVCAVWGSLRLPICAHGALNAHSMAPGRAAADARGSSSAPAITRGDRAPLL